MIVVVAIALLPREEDPIGVKRDVRIANHALFVLDQRADLAVVALHLEDTERRAGPEMAFGLGVGEPLGVGVVRSAEIVVLGEDDPRIYKERIDELARMLGGVEITAKTREHAAEMLAGAPQKRA